MLKKWWLGKHRVENTRWHRTSSTYHNSSWFQCPVSFPSAHLWCLLYLGGWSQWTRAQADKAHAKGSALPLFASEPALLSLQASAAQKCRELKLPWQLPISGVRSKWIDAPISILNGEFWEVLCTVPRDPSEPSPGASMTHLSFDFSSIPIPQLPYSSFLWDHLPNKLPAPKSSLAIIWGQPI